MERKAFLKSCKKLSIILLLFSLLLTAGCKENHPEPTQDTTQPIASTAPTEPETEPTEQETEPTEPETEPTEPETEPTEQETEPTEPETDAADTSLTSLRQAMTETPHQVAVAYFGYVVEETVDPFAFMQGEAPQLCENLPFLLAVPQENVVGTSNGELYCIVPKDPDATVAVNRGVWDESGDTCAYTEVIYRSESGEPILLFCNAGWEPDTQIVITDSDGKSVIWYPRIDDKHCVEPLRNDDGEDQLFDFSPYVEALAGAYRDMRDEGWELPVPEDLIGISWRFETYIDDREVSYQVTFHEGTCDVYWNDGIDVTGHEYPDAPWELTENGDFAVLSIDFREFADVLRYDLLLAEGRDVLYIMKDVSAGDIQTGLEPLFRHLEPVTGSAPEPTEMVGKWELAWTEVEGYRSEEGAGSRILEITADDNGLYWISFTDQEFPAWNYYDKELVLLPDELYPGCGNSQWSATAKHTGMDGTEYTVTVLEDGTLLMQEYWEMDGAPMVGYGGYRRVN